MKRKLLIALFFVFQNVCSSFAQNKPNIILILVDDMGYSDLGCTGGEINTPNIDNLAKEGLLFTNFYNTARCSPSRASLLTGMYPHRAGVGHLDRDLGYPEYQGFVKDNVATMAEVLVENGYQTILSGKWHIGSERSQWPDRRGFERFYGTPLGGGLYFYPSNFLNRDVYKNGDKIEPNPETFYSTNNFTDEAINFISESDTQKPFFLYLAYVAPHFPLQAPESDIEKYRGQYLEGYDVIRNRRFAKQKELGLINQNIEISASNYINDWDDVDQDIEDLKMATYAAQIDILDRNIGKLVDHLKTTGKYENTLIMFMSDNGAASSRVNRGNGEIGTNESFVAYGRSWANVSNTPYVKYKKQTNEGGVISPLIVHWPNGIENVNEYKRNAIHIKDIMPTCLEMADITPPTELNGKTLIPMDGKSFLKEIIEDDFEQEAYIYWEHEGNKGVRKGDWKLVQQFRRDWELYDLSNDPTELNNVLNENNSVFTDLRDHYNAWVETYKIQPWPVRPNTLGINMTNFSQQLNFSPNPTKQMVQVDLGKSYSEIQAIITDVNGKNIDQYRFHNKEEIELKLPNRKGVYLIQINSNGTNEQAILKIMKN